MTLLYAVVVTILVLGWTTAWFHMDMYRDEVTDHDATKAAVKAALADAERQLAGVRADRDNLIAQLSRVVQERDQAVQCLGLTGGVLAELSRLHQPYPGDAIPDLPAGHLDNPADAWVTEMQQRWATDFTKPPTSGEDY